MIDRRAFLAVAAGGALTAGCRMPAEPAAAPMAGLERRARAVRDTLGPGARLGFCALDTATGRELTFDAGSRYAMASTFKLPLAAFALAEVEAGRMRLDEELPFPPGAPLDNSPIVTANAARGRLAVEQLCAAVVRVSDNSAANILLRRLGGPAALTAFIRAAGDPVTRLDRFEMDLNANLPGDPRDTTSPAAMAALVRTLVLGDLMMAESRARLTEWLRSSVPGADRLRAGLPLGWGWGHKTGTGARGAVNDVGVAWPPGRPPIAIACYQDGGNVDTAVHAAAHAAVARLVAEAFTR